MNGKYVHSLIVKTFHAMNADGKLYDGDNLCYLTLTVVQVELKS